MGSLHVPKYWIHLAATAAARTNGITKLVHDIAGLGFYISLISFVDVSAHIAKRGACLAPKPRCRWKQVVRVGLEPSSDK